MGNGRDRLFACTACGSPSIAVPSLDPAATVRCGGCGQALMAWGDFKVRAQAAARGRAGTGRAAASAP